MAARVGRPGFRTSPLRLRSFAKINLGLEVLGVHDDGYHELRTLFQTIDLADEISLKPLPERAAKLAPSLNRTVRIRPACSRSAGASSSAASSRSF